MRMILSTLMLPLIMCGFAYAQISPEQGAEMAKPLFEMLLGLLPDWAVAGVLLVGSLRIVIKPVMSLLLAVGQISKNDDLVKKHDEIDRGNTLKTVTFILDWFASIKVPPKKK